MYTESGRLLYVNLLNLVALTTDIETVGRILNADTLEVEILNRCIGIVNVDVTDTGSLCVINSNYSKRLLACVLEGNHTLVVNIKRLNVGICKILV